MSKDYSTLTEMYSTPDDPVTTVEQFWHKGRGSWVWLCATKSGRSFMVDQFLNLLGVRRD